MAHEGFGPGLVLLGHSALVWAPYLLDARLSFPCLGKYSEGMQGGVLEVFPRRVAVCCIFRTGREKTTLVVMMMCFRDE